MILVETEHATLEDLHREPGKAELIGGRIVHFMPTGLLPGMIAANILDWLRQFVKLMRRGVALGDNAGYVVPRLRSGRESFSSDASFYDNPTQRNLMAFIQGPPTFAVEVRSECDYLAGAESEMAQKRADYFEAGTVVVWDVDTLKECVHCYRKENPLQKVTFVRGLIADAEPGLPGWRVPVDKVFER
jgi:Uma2 family endonuclease